MAKESSSGNFPGKISREFSEFQESRGFWAYREFLKIAEKFFENFLFLEMLKIRDKGKPYLMKIACTLSISSIVLYGHPSLVGGWYARKQFQLKKSAIALQ